MSAFLEKIERARQESPRRLGFGTAPQEKNPPLPLVVGVTTSVTEALSPETANALDGLLFKIANASELSEIQPPFENKPWGIWMDTPPPTAILSMKDHGAELLLFSPSDTSIEIMQGRELTRLLLLSMEPENDVTFNNLISGLTDFPIDAVVVALKYNPPLTVQHLIAAVRIRRLAGKPLLLSLSHFPTSQELEVLRDNNVDCVLVNVSTTTDKDVVSLRERVNNLPPRQREKQDRANFTVTKLSNSTEQGLDEADADDEEDSLL